MAFVRAVLPDGVAAALAGPPNRRGIYVFGGELERTLVSLLAPITAAALVALFFLFKHERAQGGVLNATADSITVHYPGAEANIVLNESECDPEKNCTPHHGTGEENKTGYGADGVPETENVVFDIVIPEVDR